MKAIFDVSKHKQEIGRSIRKYGHFAEHNLAHYLYAENEEEKNVFIRHGTKGKGVLLQFEEKANIWHLFPNGVLAPENERLALFLKAAHFALKEKRAKKFTVEVTEDIRRSLLQANLNGFKVRTYHYTLHWPLYDMSKWDPKLCGNRMKKLRNLKNRFYRRNSVRVVDSAAVPHSKLLALMERWLEKRRGNDEVDEEYYTNLIKHKFKGCTFAKSMYVNGKPATITAGWKIPNSNNYYSAIGICDYGYEGLGEAANVDDLNRLKRAGFDYVDFGGSDKILLRFKRKFKPHDMYKTFTFSLVRR